MHAHAHAQHEHEQGFVFIVLLVFIDVISTNLKKLQEEMATSSRQKDTLIVQLQQTLVLLSQQQFQRIVKPTESLINNQDANFMNLQALQSMQTDVNKSLSLS